MKKFFNKNKWTIAGTLIGAIAGYIYYWQIGCTTGTCAITSKPLNSMVYFAVMGGLAFSALAGDKASKAPTGTSSEINV